MLRLPASFLLAASLLAAACTSVPDAADAPEASDARTATADAAPTSVPPAGEAVVTQRNNTPFPTLMLSAEDHFGAYYTFSLKTTWLFDARGRLRLAPQDQQEALIEGATPVEDDFACRAWGAGYNQRTTWFPDTGVLVHGGTLGAAHRAGGQRHTLYPLTWQEERGTLAPMLPDSPDFSYYRVPCVGAERVSGGFVSAGYLSAGDTLRIQPASGRVLSLTLPRAHRPFVVLEPRGSTDRLVIVPMRLMLVTVSMPQRRLVLHWAATAPQQPALGLATWETLSPAAATDAPPRRQFIRFLERHLASCPPAAHAIDPCAQPARQLNPTDMLQQVLEEPVR